MISFQDLSIQLLKKIAEDMASELWKAAKGYVADSGAEERALAQRIEIHLSYVSNWCSSYNFVGLGMPKSVRDETVSLRFDSTPRRYRGRSLNREHSEIELLHQPIAISLTAHCFSLFYFIYLKRKKNFLINRR